MKRNDRYINILVSILEASLKNAVVALCRFGHSFYSNLKKLLSAVAKAFGYVKGDAVKTLSEDNVIKSCITPILRSCPVLSKESVRLRFKLSIGDGLLDARLEERA